MAKTVTIIPITSTIKKIYPFEVLLEMKDSGLSKPSKAQCHQIRTISKIRITGHKVGVVTNKIMQGVNTALKIHLDIF